MKCEFGAAVLAAAIMLMPNLALADQLRWTITSYHPNVVSLEFYSQSYNRAWPGDGQVYLLDDSAAHSYNLECSPGEQVCYGAWVRNASSTYWGVGMNDTQRCSDCCAICGDGDVESITLTE